jgi:hypothetical protein
MYSVTGRAGSVFHDFLEEFYPWEAEPPGKAVVLGRRAANVLYDEFRNPFAHVAGLLLDISDPSERRIQKKPYRVQINRVEIAEHPGGLPESQVEGLERGSRPVWLPPTLMMTEEMRAVTVESLYWGTRVAVAKLCSDRTRMQAAAEFFAPILGA